MEDITSVLWIILVAAATLFSAAKSNSAKRKRADRRTTDASGAERTEYSKTPPQLPVNAPDNNISCNFSTLPETLINPETRQVAAVEATSSQTTEQGEEFDLRKAVIYSEILRPKFEDQI